MATSKLATWITKLTYKILVVLAHSFLEWVLILFLLINSFFAYMIRKYAVYCKLKQPCILCSRVDHRLLGTTVSAAGLYKSLLVCQTHATEIFGCCSNQQSLAKSQQQMREKEAAEEKKGEEIIGCIKANDAGNQSGSGFEPRIRSDNKSSYLRVETDEDGIHEEDHQVEDGLENELDLYRKGVSGYEAEDKAMMLIQKCNENSYNYNPNFFSSISQMHTLEFSIDNNGSDDDVLSIDLNRSYSKVEDSEISLMDCSKEWGAIGDSLEELDEERLSIIEHLKELEVKLHKAKTKDETKPSNKLLEPDTCKEEVMNLAASSTYCFSTSESHSKTMASVARKLLDLVESDDDDHREDVEMSNEVDGTTITDFEIAQAPTYDDSKRVESVQKEMDIVYGRLQALEADTEFLRHCIGSVNKGHEGLTVVQEILQQLRLLRDAEICF